MPFPLPPEVVVWLPLFSRMCFIIGLGWLLLYLRRQRKLRIERERQLILQREIRPNWCDLPWRPSKIKEAESPTSEMQRVEPLAEDGASSMPVSVPVAAVEPVAETKARQPVLQSFFNLLKKEAKLEQLSEVSVLASQQSSPAVPEPQFVRSDKRSTVSVSESRYTVAGPGSEPPRDADTPHRSYIFSGWNRHKRTAEERLPRIEPADVPTVDRSDYVFGAATPLLAALLPESEAKRETVRTELRHAGYYQPHAVQNLAAIRYLGIMLPLLVLGTLLIAVPRPVEPVVAGAMLTFSLLGWALPTLYVRSRIAERKSEIERSLPDVLDMLNMCVSQGMTLLVALDRVNRELRGVYPVLSRELQIVAEQARIGTLDHALQNLNERVNVPDVHSFTTLLIQTERMGTSISAALGDYAQNMRESLRQRADEKANQATFKLLFPTVLCLMPAVYMFLLGPAVVELSDFFSGGNSPLNRASQAIQRYNNRQN